MFTPVPHIINIDLSKVINTNKTIIIKRNDNNSHLFKVNIFDNGIAYPLTGSTARIYMKKADKNTVFSDCVMDNAANGKISYLVETQAVSFAGVVSAEVTIYGPSGEILTCVTFVFIVTANIRNDAAIESTSEYTALTNALVKIDGWDAQFDEKYAGLEAEYATDLTSVKAGLANKAQQVDVRLKAEEITLTDVDAEFISAITGGTTVNLLSTPQDNSVGVRQTKYLMAEGVASKNLFDGDFESGFWAFEDGSAVVDATRDRTTTFLPVDILNPYTITKTAMIASSVHYYNSSKIWIGYDSLGLDGILSINIEGSRPFPNGTKYLRFHILKGTEVLNDFTKWQIEKGIIATSFTSFNPKTKIDGYELMNDIKGTTQSIIFNLDGTVQKIQHKDIYLIVTREDIFIYTNNLITEIRTLLNGQTMTFKYNLITLEMEVI